MLSAPFRVVLDACVLYPMHLRDVLLQAAAEGLYQAYWSKEILDEATRNLIANLQITEPQATHLIAMMSGAFPEAIVTDYEHLVAAMRNDPKDRHVAAAAVKAGAQVVVTENISDFSTMPFTYRSCPIRVGYLASQHSVCNGSNSWRQASTSRRRIGTLSCQTSVNSGRG